jgi:hypothetical protein
VNGLTRFRMLWRFWRVGAALAAILLITLLATLAVSRHSGSPTIESSRRSSLPNQPSGITAAATTAPAAAARSVPVVAAGSAASGSPSASGSASRDTNTILNAPLPPQTIDQKIVRNGSLTITAKDVAGTQDAIWNVASDFGGAVLSSNTSGTDENIRADISFRVPAERFREAMDRVRGYAVKVQKEESSAQDVTEEYVDLQARQRTLEATVLQLQTLLGKATTVDDTLKVQTQLNSVQSDLERIKGKVNYDDTRTAFSTIAVSILPMPPPTTEPVTPVATWSLGHSVREAWNRSVNGLQDVADALITIGIGGWWIVIPLIVAITLLARRKRRQSAPVAAAVSTDGT